MKKFTTLFMLIGFSLMMFNCKKVETTTPPPNTVSDVYSLATSDFANPNTGFSFYYGKIITYPNNVATKPDFYIALQLDNTGTVTVGPELLNIDNNTVTGYASFSLVGTFSSLSAAKSFYYSFQYDPTLLYTSSAINIQPFQVWQIITTDGKSAVKMLIIESLVSTSPNDPYATISFKWSWL